MGGEVRGGRLPIVGDDIKSQVGATITHRMLARLFEDRGMAIDRTYQLNFGGNMDFKNMLERTRLESKKISKTQSVTSQIEQGIESDNVHIGPSDHVPWLEDRKWAYIRLEGRNFGDVPLNIELKLEVWDSPNSAGVIIDAVRCCKVALDRGIGGPLAGPSAYFMKSPAVQYHDDEAREMVESVRAASDVEQRRAAMIQARERRRYLSDRRELRLLGDVRGKRVLDLGCGTGAAAIAFAQQGAVVIARRRAPDARSPRPASAREREEVKVEWRDGRPRRPRLPPRRLDRRRVQRCTRSPRSTTARGCSGRCSGCSSRTGRSCSPTSTRWRCASATDGAVERSYFEPGPIDVERDGETACVVHAAASGRVHRARPRRLPRRHPARAPARHAGCAHPATDRVARPQGRRLITRSLAAPQDTCARTLAPWRAARSLRSAPPPRHVRLRVMPRSRAQASSRS